MSTLFFFFWVWHNVFMTLDHRKWELIITCCKRWDLLLLFFPGTQLMVTKTMNCHEIYLCYGYFVGTRLGYIIHIYVYIGLNRGDVCPKSGTNGEYSNRNKLYIMARISNGDWSLFKKHNIFTFQFERLIQDFPWIPWCVWNSYTTLICILFWFRVHV